MDIYDKLISTAQIHALAYGRKNTIKKFKQIRQSLIDNNKSITQIAYYKFMIDYLKNKF